MDNSLSPPEPDIGDDVYTGVSAILSAIPIFGGGIVETLQYVFESPLRKRQQDFFMSLAVAIHDLQQNRGITLEAMQKNEVFMDTVFQANQIWYRTSQKEKRTALKNAIIHAGMPNAPEQSMQKVYLNWIDTFTVWHLCILKLLDDPESWEMEHEPINEVATFGHPYGHSKAKDPRTTLVISAFPQMAENSDLREIILKDLFRNDMVDNTAEYPNRVPKPTFLTRQTTDLGRDFLRFIEDEPSTSLEIK